MNFEWYEKFVNELEGCAAPEHLRSVVTQYLGELGMQQWMVAVQVPSSLHAPESYGINNFDDEWWQRYIENNWILHDPLPRYAIDNHQPRLWTINGWADIPGHRWEHDDSAAVDFFKEVESFGARSGLVIPYHLGDNTRSGLNLPHPEPIELSRVPLMLGRIWIFSAMPQIIAAVQRVYRLVRDDVGPSLTTREKEVLFWAGEGFTSKAIAAQLGISYRTVEHYLSGIQRKLGVSNRQQAVAKAVNMGLVVPITILEGITYSVSAEKERHHRNFVRK